MKIEIKSTRGVLGWDLDINIHAGEKEKIAYVEVTVNDFAKVSDTPDPPVDSWEQQLTQQGTYPGDNKALVRALDVNGQETRAQQKWS